MISNLPEDRQQLNDISSGEALEFSDSEEDDEVPLPSMEESKLSLSQNLISRDRVSTEDLKVKVQQVQKSVKVSQSKDSVKSNFVKRMVSKQKQRYEMEGFDLDLTYITPNIIAMGFPAIDFESIYRNSMEDVTRFFNLRHPNHYRIYNLCSERKYPHHHFNGQVAEYPFDDHQAPPLKLIFKFCEDIGNWLRQDEENVAGIHCKAGKGRTGLMVCSFLLYSQFLERSNDAQRYFALIRTKNRQGITIPSQIRYLDYYGIALSHNLTFNMIPSSAIMITKILLHTIPNFRTLGGCDPWFRVQNNRFEYVSSTFGPKKGNQILELDPEEVIVDGDVLVQFFNNSFKSSKEKMFQFWFHTSFVQSPFVLTKSELDSACKEKQNKKFSKDFKIEVHFIGAPTTRRRSNLMYTKEINLPPQKQNQNEIPQSARSINEELFEKEDVWKSYEVTSMVKEFNLDSEMYNF